MKPAAAESNTKNIYRFDGVAIERENFRVLKNGRAVTLTPRAFDVLILLIENGGRVVEKQEIFERVWKDAFVSDNALTKIVREIRHALDDSASQPRYIETVAKRGYRFIGFIEEDSAQAELKIEDVFDGQIADPNGKSPARIDSRQAVRTNAPGFIASKTVLFFSAAGLLTISFLLVWFAFWSREATTASAPIRSIAVLPFKPLNADSRDESLELGMTETLITRLSNLKPIAVRPISAVRNYTNPQQDPVKAGRELRAEAVLDGSIQKSGERLRVTVRLVNVGSGGTLWSEQFDENFTDIFKVQDSIADRVAVALALQLSKREKEGLARHYTENHEAYQLYLRGQLIWHRRQPQWTEQSLAHFEQAIAADPDFALAYIGAADAYIMLSGQRKISMPEAEAKARAAIIKALEIDDTLAQAHNALAELKYQYEYDWTGAEKEFKIAVELNPNLSWIRQAYGWFLMSAGRFDEAAVQMDKAGELDPNSLTINIGRGRLYYYSRQYDRAIRHFQNILAVEPEEGSSYFSLFTIYEQKQMHAEALEILLGRISNLRARPEMAEEFRQIFRRAGWQGCLRKQLEMMEEKARRGKTDHHGLANLYARLGEKDKAFAHFEKIFELRDPTIVQFKIEPAYDNLRDDPRYAALVRKINLTP